ncbi:MAG: DNA-protecting protein DprA [Magnetococcales bacterium]|nr:DNA-protecting protein DprA [Magnetococcales bacterium]
MNRQTALDWLRLIRVPGLGPIGIDRLLQHFGKAEAVLAANANQLAQVPGIRAPLVAHLENFRRQLPDEPARQELDRLARIGGQLLIRGDQDYPAILNTIHDPPPVLFVLGDPVHLHHAQAIAVVGTRQASRRGIQFSYQLGRDLASNGITTVSGLAQGIDMAAHEGALDGGGPTIGVLATGLDVSYPSHSVALKKKIVDCGCLITEAPLGTQPAPYLFPPRNRIISGLSRGVVVVEAALRSGSLITARMALEQGREVFAVPGSGANGDSRSKGVNNLIRQGAVLVEGIEDILQELSWSLRPMPEGLEKKSYSEQKQPPPLSPAPDNQRSILVQLADGPLCADELARNSQLTVASLSRILLQLELTGVVQRLSGNRYALTN